MRISQGTLYPVLRALERAGLGPASWAPDPRPKRGGRPLTAMGTKAAHDERETLIIFMGLGTAKA
jgi:DNA-binding PadR family transcriptional regulator